MNINEAVCFRPVIAALVALTACATAQGGDQQRGRALAANFQSYCLSAQPNFENLERRAEQEKLVIQVDRKIPVASDASIVQKNWIVEDFSGGFLLLATTGEGDTRKPTVNCGVAATDIGGDAFEKALTELPQLGNPTSRGSVPSGGYRVQWNKTFEWGYVEVILASQVPGMQGSIVTLFFHPPK